MYNCLSGFKLPYKRLSLNAYTYNSLPKSQIGNIIPGTSRNADNKFFRTRFIRVRGYKSVFFYRCGVPVYAVAAASTAL